MRNIFEFCAARAPILFLVSSATLGGCNTLGRLEAQSRVDPRTIAIYPLDGTEAGSAKDCAVPKAAGDYRNGAIRLDCVLTNAAEPAKSAAARATTEKAFKMYDEAARGDKTMRNRLAAVLMKHSDDICTVELGQLTAREAMVNTGLGVATSALATISALVMGDFAKSALASGASFTNATRDHINAEVYRNILSTAISSAIDEERGKMRQQLVDKFPAATTDYSVDQMVMEVNRFHQGCSFYHGIGLVLKKVNRPNASVAATRQLIGVALNEVENEIAQVDRQFKTMKADDPRRAALVEQRAALVKKRTDLINERADARLIADGGDALPVTPKPKNGEGTGEGKGTGEGEAGGVAGGGQNPDPNPGG